MTIDDVIDSYRPAAEGGVWIDACVDAHAGAVLAISATRSAFTFLGHLVAALIEEEHCTFSIEPAGAGCVYFRETETAGLGLYLHRQPCPSHVAIFPGATGAGWVCWADREQAQDEKRRSFVAVEGDSAQLRVLADALLSDVRPWRLNGDGFVLELLLMDASGSRKTE